MFDDDLTCRMRNVDPSRDRQMCPRDVATRLRCLLPPKSAPTPSAYYIYYHYISLRKLIKGKKINIFFFIIISFHISIICLKIFTIIYLSKIYISQY